MIGLNLDEHLTIDAAQQRKMIHKADPIDWETKAWFGLEEHKSKTWPAYECICVSFYQKKNESYT